MARPKKLQKLLPSQKERNVSTSATTLPPTTTPSPCLDALPTELLQTITQDLTSTQSLDLRLVCRRLAQKLYPSMPTQRTIIANSDRQLQMLIAMTEPGQPGCLLDKLILVETLPGYLLNEQVVEEIDLPCKRWSTQGVGLGPPPPDVETSSEYELSESECDSNGEKSDEDEEMEDDWEAENDVPSSSEKDDDLTLEELRITCYSPGGMPIVFSDSDKPPEDYGHALATWDTGEKTLTDLLAHAFNNLHLNTAGKALSGLDLQVARRKYRKPERDIKAKEPSVMLDLQVARRKYREPERDIKAKEPSVMLGELFHRIAIALHISRLPIHKLVLGHGSSVLGSDRLESILNDSRGARKLDLAPSLIHLKEMSIKFTNCEDDGPGMSWKEKYARKAGYGCIIELLKWAPNLRSLHLQGYHSWNAAKLGLLEQIVNSNSIVPSSLKTVKLEGFGTQLGEVDLFLRHFNTLESLTLKALYLATEEFKEISDTIVHHLQNLTYLHLDNLHEINSKAGSPESDTYFDGSDRRVKLVYFIGRGESHFPSRGPNRGPNFILRKGKDARTALGIRDHRGWGREVGSPKRYMWVRSWNRDYGGRP